MYFLCKDISLKAYIDCAYKYTYWRKTIQMWFPQSSKLTVHNRSHTGEKTFKCCLCEKAFVRKSLLNIHKRSHNGENQCKCDFCYRTFPRNDKLTVHKRIHTRGNHSNVISVKMYILKEVIKKSTKEVILEETIQI